MRKKIIFNTFSITNFKKSIYHKFNNRIIDLYVYLYYYRIKIICYKVKNTFNIRIDVKIYLW